MHTQPVTYQPNFNGKVLCINCIGIKDGSVKIPERATKNRVLDLSSKTWDKLNQMVEKEPFDIFIHPNLNNEEFFNVDAGVSFEDVMKTIQGKVKVKYNTLEALPLAIKDAIRNFEASVKEKKV